MSKRRGWGLLLSCLAIAGCRDLSKPSTSLADRKPRGTPDVDRFLASWNANARQVRSLLSTDVDIEGEAEGQPFRLTGKLAYQAPKDFRLRAYFAGANEADFGSNEREVWFWIRRANPPSVYVCSRQDLAAAEAALPIKPDWLIEALGVVPIDSRAFRAGPTYGKLMTLIAEQRGAHGEPLTKRIVVDISTWRVTAFELWNARNQPLLKAEVLDYYTDRGTGIFLPRKFAIVWTDPANGHGKMQFALCNPNFGKIRINDVTAELAQSMFTRGPIEGAQVVDLARVLRDQNIAHEAGAPRRPTADRPGAGAVQRAAAELTGEIRTPSKPRAN